MIEEIRKSMLELCKGKSWDWEEHLDQVAEYSKMLAKKLDADEEVCELAAWLHDIVKIKDSKRESHHIKGAEEAEKILEKYSYPKEKIQQVKHCILTHSSDENYMPQTKEAKILASADALSHFDSLLSLAQHGFVLKGKTAEECREFLLRKYENSWKKILIPEAREIARPKYEAIKLVLCK